MRRRAHPLRLHVWTLRLPGDAVGGDATLISPSAVLRGWARSTAVMLALASVALAIDHPITGDSLVLKDPMAASERKVRFKATRDAAIVPSEAGDPRALGATLEIAGTSAGDGATGPITLNPTLWTGLGRPAGSRGYRYFDRGRSTGVRKGAFRSGARGGALPGGGGGSAGPDQITPAQRPTGL